MTSKVTRIYTGLAGLPVCQEPQRELSKYYSRILRTLEKLPKESKYRTQTEQLIKERKTIVESSQAPEEIERKIGAGLCEELIMQAKHELQLIETMKTYKPWEPLVEKPSEEQWRWPV